MPYYSLVCVKIQTTYIVYILFLFPCYHNFFQKFILYISQFFVMASIGFVFLFFFVSFLKGSPCKHFVKKHDKLFICSYFLYAFEIFGIFCIKLSVKRAGIPFLFGSLRLWATIQNVNCH